MEADGSGRLLYGSGYASLFMVVVQAGTANLMTSLNIQSPRRDWFLI